MPSYDFAGRAIPLHGPARGVLAITPSDVEDIVGAPARGLYVGKEGRIAFLDFDGNSVSIPSLSFQYHPIFVRRVLATGTTATDIFALY